MTDRFMPYGSSPFAGLVAKVATPIKIGFFQPYGSSGQANLVSKVAIQTPKTPSRMVRRLNSAGG